MILLLYLYNFSPHWSCILDFVLLSSFQCFDILATAGILVIETTVSHSPKFIFRKACPIFLFPISCSRQNIPVLKAEYGNGRVIQIVVKNFDAEQVGQHLNLLRTRTGLPVVDLVSRQSAQVASVQGMWNPMLNINSELNISKIPEKKFSRHRAAKLSATEYVSSLIDENVSDSR